MDLFTVHANQKNNERRILCKNAVAPFNLAHPVEAGRSIECITHASHSVTFALCDPVTF